MSPARWAPAVTVSLVLVALALLLEHGGQAGVGWGVLELSGRLYFALLVFAPLLLYPLAWRRHEPSRVRVGLALLPGFLWWGTEVAGRLAWHSLPEALWLACSPFNVFHLYLGCAAMGLADLGCRFAWPHESGAPGWRRIVAVCAGVLLGPVVAVSTLFPFLFGYRALFQADLLPMPAGYPGPLSGQEFSRQQPATQSPNVVFILSDDHRWDFAGYEGHPFVETPALDRLAAEGLRFERAYVSSSLCSPSRASFLTGVYPHRHGVWNNFTTWSNENRTFFEYLARAGYATAFIGKWHMPGGLPELRGVDHFVSFTNVGGQGTYEWNPMVVDGREEPSGTRYIATELTNRALAWLDERREPGPDGSIQPFALYLSHKSVHADFTPDEPDRGRYADASPALPSGAKHPWIHLSRGQYTHLNFQPIDDSVRTYAEAIHSMDREIGRVLDYLEQGGLAENTIVIYTSDNGYQWGEKGLVDKRWAYETSIRVPLLVRYPAAGHPKGVSTPAIVANVDVAPTLLELTGITPPAYMQGQSFLPVLSDPSLRDPTTSRRDAFLYTYYFEPPYPTPSSEALVTPRYKYIEWDGLPAELYDLSQDPTESRDLISTEDPALVDRLSLQLRALSEKIRAAPEDV
jgi:N-acetylglucosamine-6-sulfatase